MYAPPTFVFHHLDINPPCMHHPHAIPPPNYLMSHSLVSVLRKLKILFATHAPPFDTHAPPKTAAIAAALGPLLRDLSFGSIFSETLEPFTAPRTISIQ